MIACCLPGWPHWPPEHGDSQAAAEVLEAALGLYREHGDQHGQANAEARAFLQQAQEAFREVDADEAVAIAAELRALADTE